VKIVLTHSEGRLAGLAGRLRAVGHQVLHVPLIQTETRREPGLQDEVARLNECPWLLLTSANAVRSWADLGGSLTPRRGVGVVGPGTAATVHGLGGRVDLLPRDGTGAGLAGAFLQMGEVGPVALPQGDRALPDAQKVLEAAGVEVRPLVVYSTLTLRWPQGLGNVDALLVASPSALDAVPAAVACSAQVVAIGPTTAEAARERGIACIQAASPDVEGVLSAFESLVVLSARREEEVNA
jgi:uroporphyrinogen-III synthase